MSTPSKKPVMDPEQVNSRLGNNTKSPSGLFVELLPLGILMALLWSNSTSIKPLEQVVAPK